MREGLAFRRSRKCRKEARRPTSQAPKGGPDSELESSSSVACSEAEELSALATILCGDNPELAPHVQQYFVS